MQNGWRYSSGSVREIGRWGDGVSDDPAGSDLRRLKTRLRDARETSRVAPPPREGAESRAPGLGMALRIGIEMVAGVGVGVAIGYGLDRWLGTAPVLVIVFFFLGAGAGALNTWRAIAAAGLGPGGANDETR